MKKALLLFPLIILFRGFIFRTTVTYLPESQLPLYPIAEPVFKRSFKQTASGKDIKEIIKTSIGLTTEKLSFTTSKCSVDPNQLLLNGRTNCIGYAALFNAVCSELLAENDLNNEWTVIHSRGYISFMGIDLHKLFRSPFFRDHDFNIVENTKTGEQFYVDATVSEYAFISFVQ